MRTNQSLLDALVMGLRFGTTFGFLDVFLGSDLSAGFWGEKQRMPALSYGAMAMLTDQASHIE